MAGRIPQQFIQDLLSRTDIVTVVSERITLKKTGQNYMACCPFHNEKTPSFSVSQDKQFFHCFGCGAHGSAIGFVMDFDRIDFLEAVRRLATEAGMEVPNSGTSGKPAEDLQPVYTVLASAARFFEAQLREPSAQVAVDYLKKRGLTGAIAKEYGIGYAPAAWDRLLNVLGADDVSRKALLKAGLIVEREGGGHYDRFRNRVMFPIRDTRGRVIGFGGRVLGDETPKYLNSPETPVFHKGRELYGLYEVQQRTRDIKQLLVVEGYMDVVGLAQYGVSEVVATLGTATTRDHIERLFRVTDDVIFCFDGDNAGRQAAWRALESALPLMTGQHQVRFMFLPESEDPDSLVRKEGREQFAERIVKSIPLSSYLLEQVAQQADLSTIDGRARVVELARPLLSKVPSEVFRQMLYTRLAEIVRMDVGQLTQILAGDVAPVQKPVQRPAAPRVSGAPSALRTAIKLLLLDTTLAVRSVSLQMIPQQDPRGALLIKMLEILRAHPHINQGMLIEMFRGTSEGDYLNKVAAWTWVPPPEGLGVEFDGALARLAGQVREERLTLLLEKAQASGLTEDEKNELKQLFASRRAGDTLSSVSARGSH